MTDMSHEIPFDTGPFDRPPIMPDQDGNFYEPTISDQVAELASLMGAFATRVDVLTDAVGQLLPHQFAPTRVGPDDHLVINLGTTATNETVRACADQLATSLPGLAGRVVFVAAADVAIVETKPDVSYEFTYEPAPWPDPARWADDTDTGYDPDDNHPDTRMHRWTCTYGPRCPARAIRHAARNNEKGGKHK